MQSVYLQRITKKYAAMGHEKTKPKQTQFQKEPKMNVNLFTATDYENETAFRPQKNKPKQTQSQYLTYPQRAKIKHAVATAEAAKLLPWLDCVGCYLFFLSTSPPYSSNFQPEGRTAAANVIFKMSPTIKGYNPSSNTLLTPGKQDSQSRPKA